MRVLMSTLPNAAFSISLDCQLDNVPGTLGRLCAAIGEAGGNIGALDGFDVRGPVLRRSLVVHCRNEEHQKTIVAAVQNLMVSQFSIGGTEHSACMRPGKLRSSVRHL